MMAIVLASCIYSKVQSRLWLLAHTPKIVLTTEQEQNRLKADATF